MRHKALFLDRDGVVNVDHGYVSAKEHFTFIDGLFDLAAAAKKAGYLVVVVTNQSGIGRGYYSEDDFHALMQWVREQFQAHGAALDAVYFCPCHPEHGVGEYKKSSSRRKPEPGMFFEAAHDLDIDLGASILVGDSASDTQAGLAAGIGKIIHFGPKKQHPESQYAATLTGVISLL